MIFEMGVTGRPRLRWRAMFFAASWEEPRPAACHFLVRAACHDVGRLAESHVRGIMFRWLLITAKPVTSTAKIGARGSNRSCTQALR